MLFFGVVFLLGGIAIVIYGLGLSVAAPGSSTINLDLLHQRDLTINVGIGLAIIGSVFTTYGVRLIHERQDEEDAAGAERRANRRPCPHCAEMVLPAAKVCAHCTRDLPEPPSAPPASQEGGFKWFRRRG